MNFKTAKAFQPELVTNERRPRTITTRSPEEFAAACDREKRGEFVIRAVNVLGPSTGNGGRNGHYELEVSWP